MMNAWIVGTIVAALAGVVGFFVVLRGSAFAAHALPLGSFTGAAAASLFGFDTFVGLIAFAALGVVGINRLGRGAHHDVATALSLVMLLGLGGFFLSLTGAYSESVYALLFGTVLGISPGEIDLVAAIAVLCVLLLAVLYRPLLLNAVSVDLAAARGIPDQRIELGFLALLGLATAIAVPVVGTLLVFSLMVGPPAAARFLTDRPGRAMLFSVGLSLLTVWAAIALAFTLNWPVGFFVGAISALLYGLGRFWAWRQWPDRDGSAPATPPAIEGLANSP